MARYALRLIALALVGGTLLLASSATHGQSSCSFPGLTIRAGTLIAGSTYAIDLPLASGCSGTVTYTLPPDPTRGAGTVPPGLTFDGSVSPPTLTGMPTAPTGHSDLHVLIYTARDANAARDTIEYRFTVEADSTPAFAETSYSKTFYVDRYELWETPLATGGNYRRSGYSLLDTATPPATAVLPTGLRYYQNVDQIVAMFPAAGNNGMPQISSFATSAAANYTLKFTDTDGDEATTTLTIAVADATSPEFTQDSVRILWILNAKPRNEFSSFRPVILHGAGGPGTTYALSGTLPAGLSWTAATRRIDGPPTEAGTFPLTLTATDSNGASDTQAVTIIVSPTTAPQSPTRSVTDCTTIELAWEPPNGGNPPPFGWTAPTITGWRIEGKQRGVDSGWRLIEEVSSYLPLGYTHSDLPPGSQWSYRVRALTAGGVNPWSITAHASTKWNSARPFHTVEVGTVIGAFSYSPAGGDIARYQWYRSPDQASLDWTPIAGATEGFYEVTDADIGQLFALGWKADTFYNSGPAVRWEVEGEPYRLTGANWFSRVLPDNSPSFDTSGERIVDPGSPVNIQLPTPTGGTGVVVHTLTPDLPDGLVFDDTAFTITGTPPPDWTGDYAFTAYDEDCDVATYALAIGPEPIILEPEPPPAPFVPVTRYGAVTVSVAAEGDAPEDAVYGVRLACGPSTFTPALAAGESYTASVVAGSLCELTMTDRQGASRVQGEFSGRLIGEGSSAATVTAVFPMDGELADQPDERLESTLVAGLTFVRWRGEERPVAEAVAALTLRVTAVHQWDAATQSWRSWFPGGEDTGVNTLDTLEPGGIYFIFAQTGTDAAN